MLSNTKKLALSAGEGLCLPKIHFFPSQLKTHKRPSNISLTGGVRGFSSW